MLFNLAGVRAAKISFILIIVEGKQQQFLEYYAQYVNQKVPKE